MCILAVTIRISRPHLLRKKIRNWNRLTNLQSVHLFQQPQEPSLYCLFCCCLQESYERAKALLKSHAKEHKNLADALLMYETLDAKEIQLVLEGKTLETR